MIIGYSTVSSVVVLWLMLGYVYLIRFCFTTCIALWIVAPYWRVKRSCSSCCCDVFRCFVGCLFIPCGRTCSTPSMFVPSPGCWHFSILCCTLFLSTLLWSLRNNPESDTGCKTKPYQIEGVIPLCGKIISCKSTIYFVDTTIWYIYLTSI